ncbi:hypothetical protein Scep_014250 [Stephania cephalantha]|uniref:Secoisolariciresinol dehydrogenase n=1 Tax=Stephania cephalantha TaxID=152367 RepID=A0AAP0J0W8_9MAGN
MATPTLSPDAHVDHTTSLPLRNRVAIVTGASRGIGRAIALHLASMGANLIINYVSNSAQAQHLADQINSSSPQPRAVPVQADVSDSVQVKSLFDRAEQSFPTHRVDILVNSAGIADPDHSTIPQTTPEEFDRIFAVNARGAFLVAREAANRVTRGGGGRIILLTSSLVASLKTNAGPYAASKAAVEAMAKILAKEMKGTLVTVNCVAPGPIETDMLIEGRSEGDLEGMVKECPHNRLGQTEDVAPLVGFLASDESEWVNGQVVRVNGGYV